jgi:Tfp pilus assembly protein PilF
VLRATLLDDSLAGQVRVCLVGEGCVGVTFRMRNDLATALEWYKRALAVDPDFGDAHHDMARVHALEGRRTWRSATSRSPR